MPEQKKATPLTVADEKLAADDQNRLSTAKTVLVISSVLIGLLCGFLVKGNTGVPLAVVGGFVIALLNLIVAAFILKVCEGLRIGAFWPIAFVCSFVVYIFVGIINRVFK